MRAFLMLSVLTGLAASQVPEDQPDLASLARRVGSLVEWASNDARLLEEGRNREAVKASIEATKDLDRSKLMNQALARAKAEGRPVLWFVPRILNAQEGFRAGRQMYRPAILDSYARSVFFSDPEVAALLNARTIPVRLVCDEALGKRFGIAAPDMVEPAVLLLSPDGEVITKRDRFRSYNAHWFRRWIHMGLGDGAVPEIDPSAVDLATLEAWSLAGHDAVVAKELARRIEQDDAKVAVLLPTHVLAAAHARRAGDTDTARKHMDAARELDEARKLSGPAAAADPLSNRRRLEAGNLELLHGNLRAAIAHFHQVQRPEFRAEAQYRLALCSWFQGKSALAERHLKDAVLVGGEGTWAIKAANSLLDGRDRTPIGPALHGFEDPFLRKLDFSLTTTANPRSEDHLEAAAKDAVHFLLRMQRDHGGWTDSRYAYWPSPDLTPNVWVSTTALACASLLEWRHLAPAAIDDALARGERYLLDESNMARGFQEEVYADLYKLVYLSKKHQHARSPEEAASARSTAGRIVRELAKQQGIEGRGENFWGHEYPNGFTTAAVMNGLELARRMGAYSPRPLMTKGAEALLSIRDQEGAYGYAAGRPPRPDENRHKDSMARSPISEAALIWAGHDSASRKALTTSMDRFWEYLPRLEAIRTCDFHTDGELGGFFFWHGIFHTTEAIAALPEAAQLGHAGKMRAFLSKIAEQDGSFIDSHEMGKSYGTAMGLLSIANVFDRRP